MTSHTPSKRWLITSLIGSSFLLSATTIFADTSMQPRTCSNCSGFSNTPSISGGYYPSPGIQGHKSFGLNSGHYRPRSYDSFKHSGKYRDHHDGQHSYRPHVPYKHRYHNGVSIGLVAPIIYSGSYYQSNTPRQYSPSVASPNRPENAITRPANPQIDAWSALGQYQSDLAMQGFSYQSEQNPRNALPKVGYALAIAVDGDYGKAAWAMNLALTANVSELHYFQADTNMQLVLAELITHYPTSAFMQATIMYFQQDYQAAGAQIDVALDQCQDCRAENNLQQLISRKLN
ncbi:hypothetical protein [Methylophaga sp. OBS3]|uniref:hypothetical protein n=1 Tax=Methylophaga sp. OBS3 TaxID=2991934 RepID=UPI0022570145|nr:hypothetical protein [Methylophaga sp. OBS3]MCX4190167.1 hypothetical protein [Methylophaga sp. OBS3]